MPNKKEKSIADDDDEDAAIAKCQGRRVGDRDKLGEAKENIPKKSTVRKDAVGWRVTALYSKGCSARERTGGTACLIREVR